MNTYSPNIYFGVPLSNDIFSRFCEMVSMVTDAKPTHSNNSLLQCFLELPVDFTANMVVLQVYTKCIKTKYKVRFLSKGTLVFLLATIVSVILPFIIAYKTNGFWLKRDVFYETPDVKFKGKYLFIGSTNDTTNPITCSSYPLYMKYMKPYLACSHTKVREIDGNNDKKIDEILMELKVNLPKNIEMHSFTLVLPLELKLHSPQCPLEMQTGVILQKQLQKKTSSILLLADMDVKQTSPLYCSNKRINTVFNNSLISDERDIKQFKLEHIVKTHQAKNLTTTISNIYTIEEAKNKNYFLFTIKIRYTEQKFYYKPRFTQIIKWAWIQYYSIFIIIYYIANQIKTYIFENRLVLYYEQNPIKQNK